MKLGLQPFELKLRAPLLTAHSTISAREGFIVSVARSGLVGAGEATPMPAFGTESYTECRDALRRLDVRPDLEDIADIPAALSALQAMPAARYGAELALLDLFARERGIPVSRLLAGEHAVEEVRCSALLDGASCSENIRQVHDGLDAGFRVFKLKIGARPHAEDLQQIEALLDEIASHPGARLRLDANGALSLETATALFEQLAGRPTDLCEQPVGRREFRALRTLKNRDLLPIAADESLLEPEGVGAVLDGPGGPAVDALVLKPMALGGLLPALELARRAAALGVASFVTTLIDGPIARAGAAQLAAALPGQSFEHGLSTLELFELEGPPDIYRPENGAIRFPDAPGLGYDR